MLGAEESGRFVLCTGATLFLVAAALIVPAYGQATPGASRVINLSPAAFRPVNNGERFTIEEGGLGRLCSTSGSGYFVAPVQLEDGAVLQRITAAVRDKSRDAFALLSLVRRTPDKSEILATTRMSTGRSESETLSADIENAVVDTQHYAYLLQLVLTGPNVCLYGAQVEYRAAGEGQGGEKIK